MKRLFTLLTYLYFSLFLHLLTFLTKVIEIQMTIKFSTGGSITSKIGNPEHKKLNTHCQTNEDSVVLERSPEQTKNGSVNIRWVSRVFPSPTYVLKLLATFFCNICCSFWLCTHSHRPACNIRGSPNHQQWLSSGGAHVFFLQFFFPFYKAGKFTWQCVSDASSETTFRKLLYFTSGSIG